MGRFRFGSRNWLGANRPAARVNRVACPALVACRPVGIITRAPLRDCRRPSWRNTSLAPPSINITPPSGSTRPPSVDSFALNNRRASAGRKASMEVINSYLEKRPRAKMQEARGQMREPDEAAMHSRKPKTEQWNACSRDENLFKRPLSRAEACFRDHLLDFGSRQPLATHGLRLAARISWTTRYSASARMPREKPRPMTFANMRRNGVRFVIAAGDRPLSLSVTENVRSNAARRPYRRR